MNFLLGTHQPQWLADPRFAEVPLFVSRRRLAGRRKLPRSTGSFVLDSGGFSELQLHGCWTLDARAYVAEVRRYRDEIGGMLWAAPQDWMCEPIVIAGGKGFKGTGLSVEEHQRRTVQNFLELRSLAPDLPFVPVLQGWSVFDYWRCEDLYNRAGVDLTKEPLVGVGSVCRRQGTAEATRIMMSLAGSVERHGGCPPSSPPRRRLRLHGFGFKVLGLRACAASLASADSMAWSFAARHEPPMPGHDGPGEGRVTGHINCANCAAYALRWRVDLLDGLTEHAGPGPLFTAPRSKAS